MPAVSESEQEIPAPPRLPKLDGNLVAPLDLPVEIVLEATDTGLIVVAASGVVTYANRAAAELLGCNPALLLGQRPLAVADLSRRTAGRVQTTFFQGAKQLRGVDCTARPLPEDGLLLTLRQPSISAEIPTRVEQAYSQALASALAGLDGETSCEVYLGEIARALAAQLGEESAAMWLHDEETGQIRLRVEYADGQVRGGDETDHPGADPSPPGGDMLLSFMERAASYDVDNAPELVPYREFLRQRGVRGLLVIPMASGGRTFGTISIRSSRRATFSAEEIARAEALAHQAALAFQLTRLASQARKAATATERERAAQERAASLVQANEALQTEIRERERAEEALQRSDEALRRTVSFLASEPPLDQFLGHVLETVAGQLSASACTFWFYDPVARVFRIHMGFENGSVRMGQLHGEQLEGPLELSDARDELQEIVRRRRPVVLNDVSGNPRLEPHRAWLQSRGVRAVLLAPLTVGENLIGVIGVHNTERETWRQDQVELAQALAGQASLAVQLTRLAEQARRAGRIEERNRLAQEIHDTLAQGFTGIVVQLEAADDLLDSPAEAREHLDIARQLARESLAEARRSVQALRPLALETADLPEALEQMVRRLNVPASVRVTFQQSGTALPLPEETAASLLRVSQEALANALRHSGASEIHVHLAYAPESVRLEVGDNGSGFDVEALSQSAGGLGISGIRRRAERLGGDCVISSRHGQGTVVALTVPLQA